MDLAPEDRKAGVFGSITSSATLWYRLQLSAELSCGNKVLD